MKKFYAMIVFFFMFFSSFSMVHKSMSFSFILKTKPECGYIQLEWEAVPGADRYYIYRGPGEGQEYPTPLTDFPIEETAYKDITDLVVNQKYCYYVKAVDADGREFAQSSESCAVFTCQEEVPEIGDQDCKMVLKYQVDNYYYYRNEIQKGPMPVSPIIRENRVYLMARFLAEEVGAEVFWDGALRKVSIKTPEGVLIEMIIGNPIAYINGTATQIDPNNKKVVPFIEKNRTYTPLRFIAYNLGAVGPDDIVWLGDSKTAVLTFNDANCKWICGCFKPYTSPTAAIVTYQFYKDCLDSGKINVNIPATMKDKLHGWLFSEYVKKFPNLKYWCVEVRLDKDGTVIAWRARPDQYPDCCKPKEECKWLCGCVRRWTEAPNNSLSIYFSLGCKQEGDLINFIVPLTLKDSNLNLTFLEYFRKYGNQNYWCLELCIDQNRKVVKWKATPEKYPKCCEEEPKWLCGCVIEVKAPSAVTNLSYLNVTFLLDCDLTRTAASTYAISPSLKDLNLGLTIQEYLAKFPDHKKWCVEILVENNKIIQWKATPEKYPDCCKPVVECKPVCGCITSAKFINDTMFVITFAVNCDLSNQILLVMQHDLKDSQYQYIMTDYIKRYPDQKYWCATLCIKGENEVVKWEATPEKYPDCCKPVIECKPVCGCILRAELIPGTTLLQIVFAVDCDFTNTIKLTMDSTLLDEKLKMVMTDYIKQYPDQKYWCATLCINSENVVVKWIATPEKYPDCCKPSLDCKEICGCILKIDPIAGTDKIQVLFAPDCDPTNVMNLVMLGNKPDNQYGLTLADYMKKYPDQKYWCANVCVIEDTEIVKWTATPEKYPDCCKKEGGRIIVHLPGNCVSGTVVLIYNSAGEVVWKGEPNANGVVDTGCVLKCPDVYTVEPRNEKCTFNPAKQEVKVPCCPDKVEIKFDCDCETYQKQCCCIVRMTTSPDANGYYSVYLKKDCSSGDPVYDLVLLFPASLKDTQTNQTILQYYQSLSNFSPPKQGCLEVAFNSSNQVISWAAYPDRSPCCGGESKGRIVTYVPEKCIEGTIMYVYDSSTTLVWKGPATKGNMFDTGCTLKCPATYTVKMVNEKCKFTPEKLELKVPCCPDYASYQFGCDCESNGRIMISIPSECVQTTYITIYDAQTGAVVLKLTPADYANGVFDTGCKLPCNKEYKIVPLNDKCKLIPESVVVKVPCCPEYAKASFEVQAETKGRIVGSVPGTCIEGTKIYIYDTNGNVVWSGAPNSNGYFDTGCTIPCKKEYKVVPKNDKFTFTPEMRSITSLPCCPERIELKFDCAAQKARIVVSLPRECSSNTKVLIYEGTNLIVTLTVNDLGVFDTGCTLKCGVYYTIKPVSEECKFSPLTQDVKTICCPEVNKVTFEATPVETKGRIVGYVSGNCIQGTKIYIYDMNENIVWTGTPNANGYFDTECTLKCPASYLVVPKNDGATFSPQSINVRLSCCPNKSEVKFDCTKKSARVMVNIPKNCISGTKVYVYEGTSNLVGTLSANDQGLFDTGCVLKCDTYYTFIPRNEKCKFSPESIYTKTTCCPEYTSITFRCDCQEEKARIIVDMIDACITNTKVLIYDSAGNLVMTLAPNDQKIFDTGCTLNCGSYYTVKPVNERCKFYPESQKVQTSCCPESTSVVFKCECETAKARIIITVPTICITYTTIYIYEGEYSANQRPVLSLTPDKTGKTDTGCVLKCNTLYTIVPKNAQCTFYPATASVKTSCCPEYSTVGFKCECQGPDSTSQNETYSSSGFFPRCVFYKEDLFI